MSKPPKSTMRAPDARWSALSGVVLCTRKPRPKNERAARMPAAPRLSFYLRDCDRKKRIRATGAPSVDRAYSVLRDHSPDRVPRRAVLLPERFRAYAFGGVRLRRALLHGRRQRSTTRRRSGGAATALFLEVHDQLDHLLDVVVLDVRIRRHRHLAPHAPTALLDLVRELRRSRRIALVLVGNVLVRRPDHLLVLGVTGVAAVLFHHVFELVRNGRAGGRDR